MAGEMDYSIQDLQQPALHVDEEELLPVVKSHTEAEAEATLGLLDPELAVSPPEVMASTTVSLGNFSREHSLNVAMSNGEAGHEMLDSLRAEYGLPDPDRAVIGAALAVAAPDDEPIRETPASLQAERRREIASIAQQMRKYPGDALETDPVSVVRDVADAAFRILSPTFDATGVAVMLADEFPEHAVVLHANLAEGLKLIQSELESPGMSRDEAAVKMYNMGLRIQKQAEFGYYSPLQEGEIRELVFGPIASRDTAGVGMQRFVAGATVAIQVAEKATAIPVVGGVVDAAGRVGMAFSRLSGGSGAGLISRTTEGAERLLELVVNRANGKELSSVRGAATTEDIIGSLVVPKVDGQDLGKQPYILSAYLEGKSADALKADPTSLFGAVPTKRMHDTVIDLADSELRGTTLIGSKKGNAYKTQQSAAQANRREFGGAGTIVPAPNGGFYVKLDKTREFGLSDVKELPTLVTPGYQVWKHIGKHLGATSFGTRSTNVAARQSEKAAAAANELLRGYWKLPAGSQVRVAKVLDEGDEGRKVFTKGELYQKGLNDQEILGYASARRAADLELDLTNLRLWSKYDALGYKGLQLNGQWGGKVVTTAEAVFEQGGKSLSSIKAWDPAAQSSRTLDNLAPNESIMRLMSPTQTGETFLVVATRDLKKLTQLHHNIIPKVEGFLPRPYRYPSYVKEFVDGRAVRTIRPAKSRLDADEIAEEARLASPGADIRVTDASEFRIVDDLDELQALDEAGLLWNSVRGTSRLVDSSGSVRLPTVQDRLRELTGSIGMEAGLKRWGEVSARAWNIKYKGLFPNGWQPGQSVRQLQAGAAADSKLVAQARNEAEFIARVLGRSDASYEGVSKRVGHRIAESLYNVGTRLDRVANKARGDKKGSQLGEDFRGLADNFIGASGRIIANAKTAPYLIYLAANPLRQLPLQMTLIPSYFGLTGGPAYLLKGGFAADFSKLTASGLVEHAALASDPLVMQFRKSGLMQSLEHHTMVDTIGTSGSAAGSSRTAELFDGGVRGLTAIGIGAGIKVEKVSAWLIARNRWLVQNPGKQLDDAALRQVAAAADEISLNPNRADRLPWTHGVLGVATQFIGMMTKQLGRTLQAIPGVPTGVLSKREAQKMAGINLLMWGLGGYGLTQLRDSLMGDPEVDAILKESEVDLEAAREIIADGLANYMGEAVLSAVWGGNTDLAITESFSPVNFLGGSVNFVRRLADGVFTADYAQLSEARWSPPILGLSSQMVEVVKFAAAVAGAPELPGGESDSVKAAAIAKRTMQLIPSLNNWTKYQAARAHRAKFDGRGAPTVEADMDAAVAAIIGVKTREEVKQWELTRLKQSMQSRESEIESVRDTAFQTSKWLLPLLDQWVDGKITYLEALPYLNDVNSFMFTTLPEEYHAEYVQALRRHIDGRWKLQYNTMVERLLSEAGSGKIPATADHIEALAQKIPDPEKRQLLVDTMRSKLFGDK